MTIKLLNKLSTKLILSISTILIIILAVYTYISVTGLTNGLTESSYQYAYNISDIVKKSLRYSMLLNRREDVYQIIKTIGTEKGVEGIRIYNRLGTIIYSTDSSEVQKKVEITDEVCFGCHNQQTALATLPAEKKMRIFKSNRNKNVLEVINPIHNEIDCSTAGCHAHSSRVEVLGMLDVMISMENLDEIIAANTRTIITNSLIILLVISFFCGLFISVLINRPIRKLTKGIEEIGKGNLSYKIPINSKDEFGHVALRFNEMSVKLETAYKEIEDWSENLNKKVQEKSEELKNIYEQVVQMEKLASLGKLSATVAHELNNPLAGILTYSKLILKKLKEQQKNGEFENMIEYLKVISEESSRCGKIVKDMLLFSHKGDNIYLQSDLKTVIDKSSSIIDYHLKVNNINLIKEYKTERSDLLCDPQKLQQAFMSLLINSIEAMPAGGNIIIELSIENGIYIIRIIDEGTGIADKDLPHIFEPFYTTKESFKGTGLGLSIVYGIISQHSGFVEVEKTSPKGTIFKITLPLKVKNS